VSLFPSILSFTSRAPALDFQTGKPSLSASSNQATLYHTGNATYRCFLPDLTGFIASSCIEPDYQRRSAKTNLAGCQPQAGIQPRYSGFRVQGTASSPPSTAQFMMLAISVSHVNIRIGGLDSSLRSEWYFHSVIARHDRAEAISWGQ